jgi:hypothetical protein
MAERLVDLVLNASPQERTEIYLSLTPEEKYALAVILDAEIENPWARWEHDPIGFIQDGLGEALWSKQRDILLSIRDNKRTVVPACHAPESHTLPRERLLGGFQSIPQERLSLSLQHRPLDRSETLCGRKSVKFTPLIIFQARY